MKNLVRVMTYPCYICMILLFFDVIFGLGIIEFFEEDAVLFFLGTLIMCFLGMTLNIFIKIKQGNADNGDYAFLFIWVLLFFVLYDVLIDNL